MTTEEKRALVKRLQDGRRAAKRARPQRLRAVEQRMDALGAEFAQLPTYPEGQQRRREIRAELRDLGQQRSRLKWAE